jgi:hypothetical protein
MGDKLLGFFWQGICVLAFTASFAAGAAQAGCYPSDQEMPADQVSAFTNSPASLLTKNPNGGTAFVSQVRDLVASSPATLQPILDLLKNANTEQKKGIGSGLSRAANACLVKDQPFATEIKNKLAAVGDREALQSYSMDWSAQDTTGSVGAAGASGSGGGVGGPTTGTLQNGGAYGSQPGATGPAGTANVPMNYFTGAGVTPTSVLSTSAF